MDSRFGNQEGLQREDRPGFAELVGESEAMRGIKTLLEKIAASPASTVLLFGESGTGKGLIAEEIHRHSARASRPFRAAQRS